MKRTVRKFYTLVEIMTVIVIAAILFGIGIPAFTTMIQGSNMTVAIRQLSAKISAARAYAVTNRCKVAVLLVEKENEAKINPDHGYSAYRVCIVNGDSSPFSFQEWIEDEDWKILPKGIFREPMTSPKEVTITAESNEKLKNMLENVLGENLSGTSINLKALIFLPSGQLIQGQKITLCHGRVITESDKLKPIKTGGEDHKLTINQYSGKVTVSSGS